MTNADLKILNELARLRRIHLSRVLGNLTEEGLKR